MTAERMKVYMMTGVTIIPNFQLKGVRQNESTIIFIVYTEVIVLSLLRGRLEEKS